MKNKGFIISSDAFLGLTLLSILILVSISYISQVDTNTWNNIDLINAGRDLSIVLDKSGVLEDAIKQSSTEVLSNKLVTTQNNICFEVNVFSEENLGVPMMSSIKAGCVKNYSELVVVNRSFVVRDNALKFYLVKVEAWYK